MGPVRLRALRLSFPLHLSLSPHSLPPSPVLLLTSLSLSFLLFLWKHSTTHDPFWAGPEGPWVFLVRF